jgi:ribosome recycling factor
MALLLSPLCKKAQDEVQKITDGFVAKADETLKTKEKEILTV